MNALRFTLRRRPAAWLDLSPLTPDRLAGQRLAAIRRLELRHGRRAAAVADYFEVEGSDRGALEFRRCSPRCINLGAGLESGSIAVRGNAGPGLGAGMRGGTIRVRGDAGDWVGAGMAGGSIEISGSAGDFAGAARPSESTGMRGGMITIWGDSGGRTGDRMRRGTILVAGNAGAYAGNGMIAGTILILGKTGAYPGYGMKRGTIVLGRRPPDMLATFRNCGHLKMEFLRLLFKELAGIDRRYAFFRDVGPEVQRFAGDSSIRGKGEILIISNSVQARTR